MQTTRRATRRVFIPAKTVAHPHAGNAENHDLGEGRAKPACGRGYASLGGSRPGAHRRRDEDGLSRGMRAL